MALTEATGTEAEAIEKMNKHLIRFTDDIEAVRDFQDPSFPLLSRGMLEKQCLLCFLVSSFPVATQWVHLAQLHTAAGRLKEATFCWEELVLLQPKDPHFHCRLGEVRCVATTASTTRTPEYISWMHMYVCL